MGTWTANNFSGGMNNFLHPSLLQSNYAARISNANLDDGKIRPFMLSRDVGGTTPSQRGDYGYPGNSFVKWYGIPYWSKNEGATSGQYYGTYDDTWGGPGIPWDSTKGNGIGVPYCVYSSSSTLPYITVTKGTTTTASDGVPNGKYKYCVTFVNWHGWEGAPGSLESYFIDVTLTGANSEAEPPIYNEVKIKLNPPTATGGEIPRNVWYAKVWRTTDNGADFYLVGYLYDWRNSGTEPELPEGVVDNNWEFSDTMQDDVLLMRSPLTESQLYNYPPPDAGKYLCESGGVFFLAVGASVQFSVSGNPHAWPQVNTIGFDSPVTGIVKEFSGVLVFTRNSAYQITGADSLETVTKASIPGSQGCMNYRSISCIDNAPVWLSNDGICTWNGESLTIPSYRVYKTDSIGEIKAACTHNGRYYLFHSNGATVYDTRNGGIFYDIDCIVDYAWTDKEADALYYYIGTSSSGRTYSFGDTSSPMEWEYESPYIGGNEILQREYYEFFVSCEGTVNVTITVDGRTILDNVTIPSGRDRFKLPKSCTGRFLQFLISGTGELSDLAVTYNG